jgi:hypothetical protein
MAGGIRGIPKVGSPTGLSVLNSISQPSAKKHREIFATGRVGGVRLGFSQAARNFVSVFREDPPCLDAKSLKSVPASKIGDLMLANDDAAFASLAALLGECYFHYWLVQGDGFDVTGWVLKDYLKCLNYISPESFSILVDIGRILHSRRHEALAFKKNAGKYVGNFNYRALHDVTRRADLSLCMGLEIEPKAALSVLNDVQRVLAINEFAGEKGIPPAVKKVLRPLRRDVDKETHRLDEIDKVLLRWSCMDRRQYEFLLNQDVVLNDIEAEEGDDDVLEDEDA